MSFVHNWPKVEDGDDVLPFISIRMWQPISENETEVYSWFAVDSAAPEDYKKNSYKAYLMCFGSTGMFEQDDVENWVSLTNTASGSMARRLLLNSRMGLLDDDRTGCRTASGGTVPRAWPSLTSVTTRTISAHCSSCGPTTSRWPPISAAATAVGTATTASRRWCRSNCAVAPTATSPTRSRGRRYELHRGQTARPGYARAGHGGTYSEQAVLGGHAPRDQRIGLTAVAVRRRTPPSGASVCRR